MGPRQGSVGLAGVVASAASDQQSQSGRPASLGVKLVIFLLSIVVVGVQLQQRHTMRLLPATDPQAMPVASQLIRYFIYWSSFDDRPTLSLFRSNIDNNDIYSILIFGQHC